MKIDYIIPAKRIVRKRDRIYGPNIGHDNRPKLICIKCCFLIRLPKGIKGYFSEKNRKCPKCGSNSYIVIVGMMFKPPRITTNRGKRQWKKMLPSLERRLKRQKERMDAE